MGDALIKVGQSIAAEFLNDVIKLALQPLENEFKNVITGATRVDITSERAGNLGGRCYHADYRTHGTGNLPRPTGRHYYHATLGAHRANELSREFCDTDGHIILRAHPDLWCGVRSGLCGYQPDLRRRPAIGLQPGPSASIGGYGCGENPASVIASITALGTFIGQSNSMLGQIVSYFQELTGLDGQTALSSAQIAAATQGAQTALSNLQTEQSGLANELANAIATGNTSWIGPLQAQLTAVGTAITNEQNVLTSIYNAQIASDTSLNDIWSTATQQAQAATNANESLSSLASQEASLNQQLIVAVADGNTGLATAIVGQLQTVGGDITTQTALMTSLQNATEMSNPAVVGAIQNLQNAIASGTSTDIASAVTNLQGTLNSNTNAVTNAETAVGEAIASGNASALTTALGNLQTALASQSAAATSAQVTAMGGVAATVQQTTNAVGNLQDTLAGLQAEQSGLQNDLIVATASGDTDLVAAINTQLTTVNDSITTTQGELTHDQRLYQCRATVAVRLGSPRHAGSIGHWRSGYTGDQ